MRTQMLKYTENALKRHPYPSQAPSFTRAFSSSPNPERKVTVLGSSGDVGQQLSLLLKLNPLVSYLSLFDYAAAKGVMKDISHIPTRAQVVAQDFIFPQREEYKHLTPIELTLEGSDLVIIPAGILARPGMTHEEIFAYNAAVVRNLCGDVAKYCPKAFVNIISNQVNSTVPIAAEVFKKAGTYDPKRLFGVTTVDVLRAKNFYADKAGILPNGVDVPVVGGHAGTTTLPLFSQAVPHANLSQEDIEAATKRTQDAGTEVVLAKGGRGSATLSMAFAGAVFADACLKGLNGVPDVVEYSYVQSEVTELPFFASKVRIGLNGVEEIMGLGSLSDYEQKALETLIPKLKQSIDKGVQFINKDT